MIVFGEKEVIVTYFHISSIVCDCNMRYLFSSLKTVLIKQFLPYNCNNYLLKIFQEF